MKLENIEQCSGNGPAVLIMRHAERYPIIDPTNVTEAPLTDKGKEDAYKLGRELAKINPVQYFSSPVYRCQQTAEGIAQGIQSVNGTAGQIGYIYNLGGPYITGDWNDVLDVIVQHGISKYIRKWFNGELPEDIVMPIAKAAALEMEIIAGQLAEGKSTINITHDFNIMIMREYYFNLRHEDIGYPDYLDGIAACLKDKKIHLYYHEHHTVIDFPDSAKLK